MRDSRENEGWGRDGNEGRRMMRSESKWKERK